MRLLQLRQVGEMVVVLSVGAIAVPGATAAPESPACVEAASPAPAPTDAVCSPAGNEFRGACPKRIFSRLIFFGLEGAETFFGAAEVAVAVEAAGAAVATGAGSGGTAAPTPPTA